ncbi:DUF177 domain-containing protein [Helicobacter suis]|uniref:Uncharacterized protein n=2 Tax=Helicobacter suis TaxID=104628 RepID=E7G2S3_9HELI|nr:hypothetical protein [Helicobacter suis]EFX42309.1 hypothetical protein HSUHS5_0217 [Helicobacter suis HS5]EFX42801.1 hypothetical protein HSUHS1_0875 [Helicobacter suis HS1]BDR27842.1 hypothetical protein HSHS1_06030 [Helicobacter suis HS1]
MRLKMQKIGYSSSPIAYEHEGIRLEGGVKRISSNLFLLEGHLQGRIQVECARSAKPFFKEILQDLKVFICDGIFDPKEGNEAGIDALDVIESFDGMIDIADVLYSEVQSIQADYHYLD